MVSCIQRIGIPGNMTEELYLFVSASTIAVLETVDRQVSGYRG